MRRRISLMSVVAFAFPAAAQAIVITVNHSGDLPDFSGGTGICDTDANFLNGFQCSLRAAIQTANANAGEDSIIFDIGLGVKTITPASLLPEITDRVTIDGFTQMTSSIRGTEVPCHDLLNHPCIELNGASAGVGANGLVFRIGSGPSLVRGLVINRFDGNGIFINGASYITVGPNYIGTDTAGGAALGNGDNGVLLIQAFQCVIGAASVDGVRQVISGNGFGGSFLGAGVHVADSSSQNRIVGNLVGTNDSQNGAIPNRYGIVLAPNAINGFNYPNNTDIGGLAASDANVIAGNSEDGVHSREHGTEVYGNFIGTNINRNATLGNGGRGIYARGSATVGGSSAGQSNIIWNNASHGIEIDGLSVPISNVRILGNYVNNNAGLGIYAHSNLSGTFIGDAASGAGNNIVGNLGGGITIAGTAGYNVNAPTWVLGNFVGAHSSGSMVSNGGCGVRLTGTLNANVGNGSTLGRNVISGSTQSYGICVEGASTEGAQILGNYIGTDATGTLAYPNALGGIWINNAVNVKIGASATGSGNLVSGNNGDGISILGADPNPNPNPSNAIQGNLIGTDFSGSLDLGNSGAGIRIHNRTLTQVGGSASGSGNLVSGNGGDGVTIAGTNPNQVPNPSNFIQGNRIGTDAAGNVDIGNDGAGIRIDGRSKTMVGGSVSIGGSTAERNLISGNQDHGIILNNADSNQILSNYIGTNAAGSQAVANNGGGVRIQSGSSNNRIGFTYVDGNLISGNVGYGVRVQDATSTNNLIGGNLIGTDLTGTVALGNTFRGVDISGAVGTMLGGYTYFHRNVISGNGFWGVLLHDLASGSFIQGNLIGTSMDGLHAVPNALDGVFVENAPDNLIGGEGDAEWNVISGNGRHGIYLLDANSTNNRIISNFIGTDLAAQAELPNAGHGVLVERASDNDIGDSAYGNVVAFNALDGVRILDSQHVAMRGNDIFQNLGLGIDLDGDGVTPNQPLNGIASANNAQGFPVIESAVAAPTVIGVAVTLHSTANSQFSIDISHDPQCDLSGYGEGLFLAGITVTTNASGVASFHEIVDVSIAPGQFITATATDPAGNTSEFSACRLITPQLNGDYDLDDDVDLIDLAALAGCLAGPDIEPAPPQPYTGTFCLYAFDSDNDLDVDLDDLQQFIDSIQP